jgi:predicted transcriptional regulator
MKKKLSKNPILHNQHSIDSLTRELKQLNEAARELEYYDKKNYKFYNELITNYYKSMNKTALDKLYNIITQKLKDTSLIKVQKNYK